MDAHDAASRGGDPRGRHARPDRALGDELATRARSPSVVLLVALADGMGGGSDVGREEWVKTDTDRRREARQGPGPGGT